MMRTVRTMALAAALSIPLAACGTTAGGGTDAACGPWRAITWSSRDTAATIDEVKAGNARRAAWCGRP